MDTSTRKNITYIYDGSLEGLLSAVFKSYELREQPDEIIDEKRFTPRLFHDTRHIDTNISHAIRVKNMLMRQCGYDAYRFVLKGSLSSDDNAATYVYRYINYLVKQISNASCKQCKNAKGCTLKGSTNISKCFTFKRRVAINNIVDDDVLPIFSIARSVDNESEKMRQFARFEHLELDDGDLWFARINPKHSVVPLVMSHFVERFNIQPFIIYDELHSLAGVYEGNNWFLVNATDEMVVANEKRKSPEEMLIQEAWRRFYKTLSIDSRYHPELQRNFMPKRFWKNLTEMKDSTGNFMEVYRCP